MKLIYRRIISRKQKSIIVLKQIKDLKISVYINKPIKCIYHIYGVTHIEKNIRVCKQFINSKIINDSEKIKNVKISRQLNKLANKIYHRI